MSWRKAGELALDWAEKARRHALAQELDRETAGKCHEIARHFERFAVECGYRSEREDVTVVERHLSLVPPSEPKPG